MPLRTGDAKPPPEAQRLTKALGACLIPNPKFQFFHGRVPRKSQEPPGCPGSDSTRSTLCKLGQEPAIWVGFLQGSVFLQR